MKIETKCIQSGYTPQNGESRVLPITQSTTFKYESTEQMGRLFDLEENGYSAGSANLRYPPGLNEQGAIPSCPHHRQTAF